MIKIKDFIFNENKIESIRYRDNGLFVCVGEETYVIPNAIFDDIEWNYEDEQIRK